jgi:CubicO group peptidase (beta-lactamase class C family)
MKKHKAFLLFFVIGLAFSARCQSTETIWEKTDAFVENLIDSSQIIGLNYAVLVDNEVMHMQSFGAAHAQLDTPLGLDHIFPVASISKLFSSIALHRLLYAQNRSVEESVGEFLDDRIDLPESWRNLTLKQLLSHTSGIPDQIDYQIYLAPPSDAFVIEALKDKPFSSLTGTSSKYNATGFLLIRMVIEVLAGTDFETHMIEQYFEPLGLSTAKYGGFKKVIPNRVSCYQKVGEELELFPLNYSSVSYAGAGLNIGMKDLIKWFQAIQHPDFMSQDLLDEIWTAVPLSNGGYSDFGLGWEASYLPADFRMVGHGGAGISSFRHYWNTKTNQNVTVVILTNGALNWPLRPNQINAQIANMVLSE